MTAILVVLVLGVSTTLWSIVGLGRLIGFQLRRPPARPDESAGPPFRSPGRLTAGRVAVLVAAHDEELVIAETISTACQQVPAANVFVVSDGSTDRTAQVARAAGVTALELQPNRGKAGALAAGIEAFDLCQRFDVVLLLDADTHLSPNYLRSALPLFDDPDVVAVAGRARTIDDRASPRRFGRFLLAYRERLYLIVQLLMKFGQAARWANAVSIVPGFASMYRTSALAHIDVVGAGLVIEDFNMTFEVHARRLGRVEFHPWAAEAFTQDPDRLGDYVGQVRRWVLGFWQTVRRHRLGVGVFWAALALFVVELITSSLLFVLLLPALLLTATAGLVQQIDPSAWSAALSGLLPPQQLVLGVLLPDYLLTVLAALVLRRPRYLLLGLGFPVMRILDAALCLRMLPRAWRSSSSGTWVSPTRRANLTKGETMTVQQWAPAVPDGAR